MMSVLHMNTGALAKSCVSCSAYTFAESEASLCYYYKKKLHVINVQIWGFISVYVCLFACVHIYTHVFIYAGIHS